MELQQCGCLPGELDDTYQLLFQTEEELAGVERERDELRLVVKELLGYSSRPSVVVN